MKKAASKPLTKQQQAELVELQAMPEDNINTKDIPEQRDWTGAKRGLFFRPLKKQLTLRLDADLIDWFKSHAKGEEGYQTSINRALREFVEGRGV